ncbi:MAG: hypothetical protein AB7F86_06080 [Bdellovibrionales bacterium]
MLRRTYKFAALAAILWASTACSKGGNLTLEPGAVKNKSKGAPYFQVNQGGKSRLEGAGGVHALMVTVQPVKSQSVSGVSGFSGVVNKVAGKK